MRLKVFSIYDRKAEAFNQPFFLLTEGEAIRSFQALLTEENHMFKKFPHDFTLYMLGEFHNENGALVTDLKDLGTAASHMVDQHNVEVLFPEQESQ